MGFEYVSKLPTPDEIKEQFPLAPELAAVKAVKDAEIRDVFTGKAINSSLSSDLVPPTGQIPYAITLTAWPKFRTG